MSKLYLWIALIVGSVIIVGFLVGLVWAIIVGNKWAEMFGWGEDENDD